MVTWLTWSTDVELGEKKKKKKKKKKKSLTVSFEDENKKDESLESVSRSPKSLKNLFFYAGSHTSLSLCFALTRSTWIRGYDSFL